MGNTRDSEVLLVYDRQCPACEFYCRHAEIDAAHGTLRRIDAREPSDIRDLARARGLISIRAWCSRRRDASITARTRSTS